MTVLTGVLATAAFLTTLVRGFLVGAAIRAAATAEGAAAAGVMQGPGRHSNQSTRLYLAVVQRRLAHSPRHGAALRSINSATGSATVSGTERQIESSAKRRSAQNAGTH